MRNTVFSCKLSGFSCKLSVFSFQLSVVSILFFWNIVYANDTPRLGLTIIPRPFPQMHVPLNENAWKIDALIFPMLGAYPASASPVINNPTEGDLFIVPAGGEGDWLGHDKDLAVYQNAAWSFVKPAAGWVVQSPISYSYNVYRWKSLVYSGSAWRELNGAIQQNLYLGNYDPGAGAQYGWSNLFINYDGAQPGAGLGPVYVQSATAAQHLFSVLVNNPNTDLSAEASLGSVTDSESIRLSTFRKSYIKQWTGFGGETSPQAPVHSNTTIRANVGYEIGNHSGYNGVIPTGKRPIVSGGIIIGVTD